VDDLSTLVSVMNLKPQPKKDAPLNTKQKTKEELKKEAVELKKIGKFTEENKAYNLRKKMEKPNEILKNIDNKNIVYLESNLNTLGDLLPLCKINVYDLEKQRNQTFLDYAAKSNNEEVFGYFLKKLLESGKIAEAGGLIFSIVGTEYDEKLYKLWCSHYNKLSITEEQNSSNGIWGTIFGTIFGYKESNQNTKSESIQDKKTTSFTQNLIARGSGSNSSLDISKNYYSKEIISIAASYKNKLIEAEEQTSKSTNSNRGKPPQNLKLSHLEKVYKRYNPEKRT